MRVVLARVRCSRGYRARSRRPNGQHRHGERTTAAIAEQRKFGALLKNAPGWPDIVLGSPSFDPIVMSCATVVRGTGRTMGRPPRPIQNISGLPQGLEGRPAAGWGAED